MKHYYSDDQLRNRIRGAISETASLRQAISDARKHISRQQIDWFIPWLLQFPEAKKALGAAAIRKDYLGFQLDEVFPALGLEDELRWVVQVLLSNSSVVAQLRLARDEIAKALLRGQDVTGLLKDVEKKMGKSLWSIDIATFDMQLRGGIELQKQFAKDIQDVAKHSFAAFYSYYVSARNEQSVTPTGFRARVEKASLDWKVESSYARFAKYKLLRDLPDDRDGLADILRYEQRSGLIDLYQTFIGVVNAALHIAAHGKQQDRDAIAEIIEPLIDLGDPVISKLHFWARPSNRFARLQHAQRLAVDSAFLFGRYHEAKLLAAEQVRNDPSDVSTLICYAKSCAAVGVPPDDHGLTDSLLGKVLTDLFHVFMMTEDSENSANDLLKLRLNLDCVFIGAGLAAPAEYRLSSVVDASKLNQRNLLAFRHVEPQEQQIRTDWSPAEWGLLAKIFPKSDTLIVEQFVASTDQSVVLDGSLFGNDVRHEAIARRSIRLKAWNMAIGQAKALVDSGNSFFSSEGLLLQIRALLSAGNLIDALRLMLLTFLGRPYLACFLPFDELFSGKEWRDFKRHAGAIEIPIAFDVYWKLRHQNEHLRSRRLAWRMFLKERHVRRPMELLSKCDDTDRELLPYFLENICIPEVMDISTAFSTVTDIDEERTRICSALAELCPERRNQFDEEIVQISRRRRIETGLKDIDSSRIYVDEASLLQSIERDFSEDYKRYKEHKQGKVASSDADLLDTLYDLIQRVKTQGVGLHVPGAEPAERILHELATVICTQFLQHPLYGLDRFLSMRVRHGSIDGHLRGALLDKHYLLTSYDDSTQKYLPNTHWLSVIKLEDDNDRVWFSDRLSAFSLEFDTALDKFISENLQLMTADTPEGFLKISVPNVWLASLRRLIGPEATITDFAHVIFQAMCYPQTQSCLKGLRREIQTSLTSRLVKIINDLQLEVGKRLDHGLVRDFENTLSLAEYDLRQALDTVEKWFYFSQAETTGSATYSVEHALDISLEATKAARPGFAPTLLPSIERNANLVVSPTVLSWMTDALFIAFDNVYRHSKLDEKPTIKVSVSVVDDKYFCIRTESQVGPAARSKKIDDRLDEIRQAIASNEYIRYTRKEGRSGLIRLRSICFTTSEIPEPVTFGYVGDEWFYVELKYPVDLLKAFLPEGA